jgi:hypothetical protein
MGRRPVGSGRSTRVLRPSLEGLEQREVMTVVFSPALGDPTVLWRPNNTAGKPANQAVTGPITNPAALNNPTVYFIFWGTTWGNTPNQLASDAQTIIQSPFLSGLKQYGSSGTATYGGYYVDNPNVTKDTEPHYTYNAGEPEIRSIVPKMTSWLQPKDASAVDSPVYVVVFDYTNFTNNIADGFNYTFDYGQGLVANAIEIQKVSSNTEDRFTATLSHELAERISDGTGSGIGVNEPAGLGGHQISDGEPDGPQYTYLLNGTILVQAYWSVVDQGFIVPDGNQETVYLTPIWNPPVRPNTTPTFAKKFKMLVVDSEFRYISDTVFVDLNCRGGVLVTLEGESFSFPHVLPQDGTTYTYQVTIDLKGATDKAVIRNTTANDPVTINDYFETISGTDSVIISSPYDQNLDHIQGNVTVNGGWGNDTLTINDQRDSSTSNHTYTMTGSTFTRTGSALISYNAMNVVTVNGGDSETYNVQGTDSGSTTYLNSGTNTVNVSSSSDMGSSGSVQSIFGTVNIDDQSGTTTLNIDDWADPTAHIDENNVTLGSFTPFGDSAWG